MQACRLCQTKRGGEGRFFSLPSLPERRADSAGLSIGIKEALPVNRLGVCPGKPEGDNVSSGLTTPIYGVDRVGSMRNGLHIGLPSIWSFFKYKGWIGNYFNLNGGDKSGSG